MPKFSMFWKHQRKESFWGKYLSCDNWEGFEQVWINFYKAGLLRLSWANAVSRWKAALARASGNLENSSVSLRWHLGTSEQWKVYFCSPGQVIFRQQGLCTLHIRYWWARQHNLYCWQISALLVGWTKGWGKRCLKVQVFISILTTVLQHYSNQLSQLMKC